ncbi:hypothetical protein H5410_003115 [Solanum commersonii]|uniref:Uncharacterized protein n=1 Tax=Solanum commersonii TaxID=4109 RepID=A0A9J6B3T7_SOLCO|nr:hypothetical protein H5410_003115 [Solanum commersonii]
MINRSSGLESKLYLSTSLCFVCICSIDINTPDRIEYIVVDKNDGAPNNSPFQSTVLVERTVLGKKRKLIHLNWKMMRNEYCFELID